MLVRLLRITVKNETKPFSRKAPERAGEGNSERWEIIIKCSVRLQTFSLNYH